MGVAYVGRWWGVGGGGGVGWAGGDGGGGGAGVGGKQTLAKHLEPVPTFAQAASVPSHFMLHTTFASSQVLPQKQKPLEQSAAVKGNILAGRIRRRDLE